MDARVAAPASPYLLQAGAVIPAALITGIRSDLPGQVADAGVAQLGGRDQLADHPPVVLAGVAGQRSGVEWLADRNASRRSNRKFRSRESSRASLRWRVETGQPLLNWARSR